MMQKNLNKFLLYPKKVIRVTQRYSEQHPALDFGGVRIGDDNVWCCGDGKVTEVGFGAKFGNYVKVFHQHLGMTTLYLHLREVMVKEGQEVTSLTMIGLEGDTGNTNGAHLHLGVYKGVYTNYWRNHVNPLTVLRMADFHEFYEGDLPNRVQEREIISIESNDDLAEKGTSEFYRQKLIELRQYFKDGMDAIDEVL